MRPKIFCGCAGEGVGNLWCDAGRTALRAARLAGELELGTGGCLGLGCILLCRKRVLGMTAYPWPFGLATPNGSAVLLAAQPQGLRYKQATGLFA